MKIQFPERHQLPILNSISDKFQSVKNAIVEKFGSSNLLNGQSLLKFAEENKAYAAAAAAGATALTGVVIYKLLPNAGEIVNNDGNCKDDNETLVNYTDVNGTLVRFTAAGVNKIDQNTTQANTTSVYDYIPNMSTTGYFLTALALGTILTGIAVYREYKSSRPKLRNSKPVSSTTNLRQPVTRRSNQKNQVRQEITTQRGLSDSSINQSSINQRLLTTGEGDPKNQVQQKITPQPKLSDVIEEIEKARIFDNLSGFWTRAGARYELSQVLFSVYNPQKLYDLLTQKLGVSTKHLNLLNTASEVFCSSVGEEDKVLKLLTKSLFGNLFNMSITGFPFIDNDRHRGWGPITSADVVKKLMEGLEPKKEEGKNSNVLPASKASNYSLGTNEKGVSRRTASSPTEIDETNGLIELFTKDSNPEKQRIKKAITRSNLFGAIDIDELRQAAGSGASALKDFLEKKLSSRQLVAVFYIARHYSPYTLNAKGLQLASVGEDLAKCLFPSINSDTASQLSLDLVRLCLEAYHLEDVIARQLEFTYVFKSRRDARYTLMDILSGEYSLQDLFNTLKTTLEDPLESTLTLLKRASTAFNSSLNDHNGKDQALKILAKSLFGELVKPENSSFTDAFIVEKLMLAIYSVSIAPTEEGKAGSGDPTTLSTSNTLKNNLGPTDYSALEEDEPVRTESSHEDFWTPAALT